MNIGREMNKLNGKMVRLRATPSRGQVSTDMASSLLKFSAMAQNYETMGAVDDTLKAFVKVIEKFFCRLLMKKKISLRP